MGEEAAVEQYQRTHRGPVSRHQVSALGRTHVEADGEERVGAGEFGEYEFGIRAEVAGIGLHDGDPGWWRGGGGGRQRGLLVGCRDQNTHSVKAEPRCFE